MSGKSHNSVNRRNRRDLARKGEGLIKGEELTAEQKIKRREQEAEGRVIDFVEQPQKPSRREK